MSIVLTTESKEFENEKMPSMNKKYIHFSDQEVKWICNRIGKDYEGRIKAVRLLREKFSNLKDYETRLLKGEKLYMLGWYKINLILFGRINVSVETLYSIHPKYNDVIYQDNPYIEIKVITDFCNHATKIIGYSSGVIRIMVFDLIKIYMNYQCSLVELLPNIDDFIEKVGRFNIKAKNRLINMKYILSNMGYEVIYKIEKKETDIFRGMNKNLNNEFYTALEMYYTYLNNNKKIKTVKTITSHLRKFYNFIGEMYSDTIRLSDVSNKEIVEFISYNLKNINMFGKVNSNATINHRLQAIDGMWRYLINAQAYNLQENIVSKYDHLNEAKVYPKKILESEVFKIVNAVINYDEKRYSIQRAVIILLIFTGRRIHEVLSLKYNCFYNGQVYFHKTKNGEPISVKVNKLCISAIIEAQEYAKNIKGEIYSQLDNQSFRRLFVSVKYKGKFLIADTTIENVFKKIQIHNGIIDEKGCAKYSLHDNKRSFVSMMLSAGITPQEISKLMKQQINCLIPYEVNNELALKTLKSVEEKGLLVGNPFETQEVCKNSNRYKIMDILKNVDVINRHKENLLYKAQNLNETFPLPLGSCNSVENIELCGQILCLMCENQKVPDLNEIDKYSVKLFKHVYSNRKSSDIRRVETATVRVLENVYIKKEFYDLDAFNKKVKEIKKIARKELKADE